MRGEEEKEGGGQWREGETNGACVWVVCVCVCVCVCGLCVSVFGTVTSQTAVFLAAPQVPPPPPALFSLSPLPACAGAHR